MKRKISKLLGIGLILALLSSMLLTAAPVLADVTQPLVDLSDDEISDRDVEYSISFMISEELEYDAVLADNAWIEVRFPDDTELDDGVLGVADVELSATSGIGSDSFDGVNPTDIEVDEDDITVKVYLPAGLNAQGKIGRMASVEVAIGVVDGVDNPTEPGMYTLEVQTSEEDDWVESEEYEVESPTVGGFVYVYNKSDVLVATYGGETALEVADADLMFDNEDYKFVVGPGTYVLGAPITITGEGITIESDAGVDDTIVDKDGFIIAADEVTITGFTLDDAPGAAITINGEEAVVEDNLITDGVIGIEVQGGAMTDTDIVDNVIEDCEDGIVFTAGGGDLEDCDVTGNEITGADNNGAIVFLGGNEDIDIRNNTLELNDAPAIHFAAGGADSDNIDITGNTISENDADGFHIDHLVWDLKILENTITDNEDAGLFIWEWDNTESAIMFNDIEGNDDSIDTDPDIAYAMFNWWGTTDDDDIEDSFAGGGDIEYEPYLMDMVGSISGGQDIEIDGDREVDGDGAADALDGKDDAGVSVSGMDDDAGIGADFISALMYESNPEGDVDDAIAFYDVLILMDANADLDEVNGKIKLYDGGIDEASVAHFWTGDFWAECSDQEARDGVVYVSITEDTVPSFDELEETPFVVTAGEEEPAVTEPELLAPEPGESDVILRPAFAWTAVDDADGYCFELADRSSYILPLASFNDDQALLTVTGYSHPEALEYSKSYYWRVRAVSGSSKTSKGVTTFEEQSDWVTGVFTTMDEPEEPAPPIVVEETQPPDIIVEPIVEVTTPATTQITPSWIYVIIGIGAVLVIALIVLIVRTRRVA
jgi:hypothetical protein